jgi:hypothetical protein
VVEAKAGSTVCGGRALIVVAQNDAINAIDLMIDAAGVDELIAQLNKLKSDSSTSHVHIENLGTRSPYGHQNLFKGLILQWIGEPEFFGETNNSMA